MKKSFSRTRKCLSLVTLGISLHISAIGATSQQDLVRLSGHMPNKVVSQATFVDRLEESTPVPVTFVLPIRHQEMLAKLIERIYDPKDPQYGRYLTTEEFIEQFAPTREDYDQVVAYAKSIGLQVDTVHPNRILISVSGKASTIESAFNLQFHQYKSEENDLFYAPDSEPEVPSSIASKITGIVGLSNHAKWKSYHYRKKRSLSELALSKLSSGPVGGMTPNDIVKAYNLSGVPVKGTNQSIALFELADYSDSDITTYLNYFGLPPASVRRVLVSGGSASGANSEVTLDIQLALALAPQSTIYVYEGPATYQGVLDTYNQIATDNIAKQVSTSWGMGEDLATDQHRQTINTIFQQMAVQGQTMYAASGDTGAYGDYQSTGSMALVVSDPASQPYATAVGGTSLKVDSATGEYQTESVWNDGLAQGAGGGGVSTVWPIPSWQSDVSTAYSKTYRNVPDVALNADGNTGYAICFNGEWDIFGGTSCAAPLWAAFTALVNESLTNAGKAPLGFANPVLYGIAKSDSYLTDFHDVTTGDNYYYHAGMGYDNATGLGSFNGANLYATLTKSQLPPIPIPPVPTPPPVPVPGGPSYHATLTHKGSFSKGAVGTYTVLISNIGGSSTSGPSFLAITLPQGLTYRSASGSGWIGSGRTLIFEQNQVLKPGASYPPLVLQVNVDKGAPSSVVTLAIVSGGGAAYVVMQDPTTVQ
jgi:kumamolisin